MQSRVPPTVAVNLSDMHDSSDDDPSFDTRGDTVTDPQAQDEDDEIDGDDDEAEHEEVADSNNPNVPVEEVIPPFVPTPLPAWPPNPSPDLQGCMIRLEADIENKHRESNHQMVSGCVQFQACFSFLHKPPFNVYVQAILRRRLEEISQIVKATLLGRPGASGSHSSAAAIAKIEEENKKSIVDTIHEALQNPSTKVCSLLLYSCVSESFLSCKLMVQGLMGERVKHLLSSVPYPYLSKATLEHACRELGEYFFEVTKRQDISMADW